MEDESQGSRYGRDILFLIVGMGFGVIILSTGRKFFGVHAKV